MMKYILRSASSRSSRMVFKGIMCFALVFFFLSCRSHNTPLISRMDTNSYQVHVLQRIDTIYRHDSVFIHERMKGDTVYLTRTEYRDRWRIREVHDTIRDTQYVTQVVEHPPEKYVPKFYKWCTGLFLAIIAGVILYYVLKIVIRYYLRK